MDFKKKMMQSNIVIDESLNYNFCGGNKIRKLNYIIKDKNVYEGLLTYGSKYSSHCLATAYLGYQKSIKVKLLIVNEDTSISKYPHLKLANEFGADISFIGTENLFEKIENQKKKHTNFFWINGGGHTIEGLNSYRDWFSELINKNTALKKFKNLILPFGTGTTALGIAQGIYDMNLDIKVYGISVARDKATCIKESSTMVDTKVLDIIEIDERFSGKYGYSDTAQKTVALNFFKNYGIFPDPIYNIRVAQFLEDRPLKNCIVINTGGQLNSLLNIDYDKGIVE